MTPVLPRQPRTQTLIATLAVVSLMWSVAACGDRTPETTEPPPPITATMPQLVERYVSTDPDLSPPTLGGQLVVGPDGAVLMFANHPSGNQMLVVDSSGKELYRFGKTGSGPGELQVPRPLKVDSHGATVMEMTKIGLD